MSYTTLGDPHLGRTFKTGVPLHRVGDREAMQWFDFAKSLSNPKGLLHITMGDLFDKFVVPPEVVLEAARLYINAAKNYPEVTYVILEGNHDVSKDADRASSFDIFKQLVAGVSNIEVVSEDARVIAGYGFVPYSTFGKTDDLVERLPNDLPTIFGHWDLVDLGGDNVIPTKLLAAKGIATAISGHDHTPRKLKRDGVSVIVTGSMQPYSHTEDPTSKMYTTLTLEQLPLRDVTNMNVRLVLGEGEVLPAGIDCLSLTAMRAVSEDLVVDTSEFESLDVKVMLFQSLSGLSIRDALMERFQQNGD